MWDDGWILGRDRSSEPLSEPDRVRPVPANDTLSVLIDFDKPDAPQLARRVVPCSLSYRSSSSLVGGGKRTMCSLDVELAGASIGLRAHGSGADVDPRLLEDESRLREGVPGIDRDGE